MARPVLLELRDLHYLNALARLKHFAKAAEECGVSQPAFSMRLRALEDRLDVTIVRRGNRYQGLTAEGEAILRHGRRILDDMRLLEQDLRAAQGEISGTLWIGVIPTAAAHAAKLAIRLHQSSPGIVARIETMTSLRIQQRLEEGTIDAGITYSDGVSGDMMTVEPLYEESYVLLAPEGLVRTEGDEISWADAAELPLAMLEPGMQNRRILDRMFDEVGAAPRVVSETSALTTAIVMAREGHSATVLPSVLMDALGRLSGTRVLRLVDPDLRKSISLVSGVRSPGLPTVEALRRIGLGHEHDKQNGSKHKN